MTPPRTPYIKSSLLFEDTNFISTRRHLVGFIAKSVSYAFIETNVYSSSISKTIEIGLQGGGGATHGQSFCSKYFKKSTRKTAELRQGKSSQDAQSVSGMNFRI